MEGEGADHAGDSVSVAFARIEADLGGGFIEDGCVGDVCLDQKESTALPETCRAPTTVTISVL